MPAPRRPKGDVTTSYTEIKAAQPDAHGNYIYLAVGVDRQDRRTYAVMMMAREDAEESFDSIAEYEATDEGRAAAEAAFLIAERTLSRADGFNSNLTE